MSLQNRQLRTTLPATKLQTYSETVKVSPQTTQKHSRYDAHTKELPRLLPKQLVRVQDTSTKKWSIPGEVLQKAKTPNSYVVKTPKGVLRKNRINIREAAMPGQQVPTKQAPAAAPMAPKQLILKPAKTTEISRTAAKPPSTQPTGLEKLRVAAMPPSEPQPALHLWHLWPHLHQGSQVEVCQNHILSSRKMTGPTIPQGLAIIIKPFPRSQFQSPLAQCTFLTNHRTPPRRQPHCTGPTELVSLIRGMQTL